MNGDKWPVRPSALLANPSCKNRLTGAAFTAKQQHGIRCCGSTGVLKEGGESRTARLKRAFADGLVEPILQFGKLSLQNVGGHDTPSRRADLFGSERLRQIVHGPELHRFDR